MPTPPVTSRPVNLPPTQPSHCTFGRSRAFGSRGWGKTVKNPFIQRAFYPPSSTLSPKRLLLPCTPNAVGSLEEEGGNSRRSLRSLRPSSVPPPLSPCLESSSAVSPCARLLSAAAAFELQCTYHHPLLNRSKQDNVDNTGQFQRSVHVQPSSQKDALITILSTTQKDKL